MYDIPRRHRIAVFDAMDIFVQFIDLAEQRVQRVIRFRSGGHLAVCIESNLSARGVEPWVMMERAVTGKSLRQMDLVSI